MLSDPTAQDFTSLASVRNGNAMISSCLEYLEKIKKRVTDQVDISGIIGIYQICTLERMQKLDRNAFTYCYGHFDPYDLHG